MIADSTSTGPGPLSRRGGVLLVGAFVLSLVAADLHPLSHPVDEAPTCVACQAAEQPVDGEAALDPVPDLHPPAEAVPAPVAAGPRNPYREGDHAARAPPEGRLRLT